MYEAHEAVGDGRDPRPLLFLRKINDSGGRLKCRDFIFVCGNIHHCCKILMFWELESDFVINCEFTRNVTYYSLNRLSDLMSGWRFLQIEPNIQILAL